MYRPLVEDPLEPPPVGILSVDFPGMYRLPGGGSDLPSPRRAKIPGARVRMYPGTLQDTSFAAVMAMTPSVDSPASVGAHGNSSLVWEMKSVEIEFNDEMGMDREVQIPGLPPGEDFFIWPCYTDKTCLRNWLTYDIGRRLRYWAPRTMFVETFINGTYEGLFLLIEMVRRDKDRVDVPKVAPDMAQGDVSGGYIVKFNTKRFENSQYLAKSGQPWNYHYPRYDEITPAQKTYLHAFIDKFEASFNPPAVNTVETSFKSMIDVQSWVDVAIMHELSNNPDGYWRSQYFFKAPDAAGGKLFLGPLWDFDFAWGNTTIRDAFRTDFFSYVKQPMALPKDDNHKWPALFTKLWEDPQFRLAVRARWDELRKSILGVEALNARIDQGVAAINAAQVRHNMRNGVVSSTSKVNVWSTGSKATTYQANIAYLKDWIAKRIAWLDANLAAACP